MVALGESFPLSENQPQDTPGGAQENFFTPRTASKSDHLKRFFFLAGWIGRIVERLGFQSQRLSVAGEGQ